MNAYRNDSPTWNIAIASSPKTCTRASVRKPMRGLNQ